MVAKEAIREAVRTQQDVVLVDTAGRMQVQLACLRLCFSHTVCTVTLEPFFKEVMLVYCMEGLSFLVVVDISTYIQKPGHYRR
jgi:hypothetical protein